MKLNPKITAIGFLGAFSGLAFGASIAVDFNSTRIHASPTVATVADFQVADANFEDTGTVHSVPVGNTTVWGQFTSGVLIGDGLTVTTENVGKSSFSAGAGKWTFGEAILESYVYGVGGADVTISGLSQFTNGELITVTVYGMGDSTGQNTSFDITYNAGLQAGYATNFGTDNATETDSVRFDQETFFADGTDTIVIEAYDHFNGFSISVIPEPSSAVLSGLALLGFVARRRRA